MNVVSSILTYCSMCAFGTGSGNTSFRESRGEESWDALHKISLVGNFAILCGYGVTVATLA